MLMVFPRIITGIKYFKYPNLCPGKPYKSRHSCFLDDVAHSKDASKGVNKHLSLKKKIKQRAWAGPFLEAPGNYRAR